MHFYRRKLPHWQHPEARYFIRFRLAGSLPKEATQKIKSQRKEIEKNPMRVPNVYPLSRSGALRRNVKAATRA
jgi:hypothetical protein